MITSWCAVIIAFIASSILSQQLAKKRGRDEYFYFFAGLVMGPLALLILLAPGPAEAEEKTREASKPMRLVKGRPCPECHRSVAPRIRTCPYCGASLETAWWENPVSMGQH